MCLAVYGLTGKHLQVVEHDPKLGTKLSSCMLLAARAVARKVLVVLAVSDPIADACGQTGMQLHALEKP